MMPHGRREGRDHSGVMRVLILLLVVSVLLPVQGTWADDATVLPQGVARVFVDSRASLPITQRFTASGGTTDLAADFNRDLNRAVFADLGRLEQAFGLPAGSATFGRSVVEFTRYTQSITLQAAYGLTDRLSVGVRVPYFTQQVEVDAALDARTATVGINPAVPGGVAPLRVPGTRPPTTEDVQAALVRLGFARVEDWRDASFGDSFGGVKYQYYRSDHWRLAVTGSVRVPTGRWDDPNNLVDVSNGFDAWGLGIQFHQDWVWQPPSLARRLGIPTPGTFFLNTTVRYETILPDTKPFRVCNIHQPVCPDFDPQVSRDVGDNIEAEIAGTVGLVLPGLTLTPLYTYSYKFLDTFHGDLALDYRQLQGETDAETHTLEVRLGYSTALLYATQRFPFPLTVSLRYLDRVAGTNNRVQSRFLGLMIDAYF